MDEAIMDNYIRKRPCAEARKLLVVLWILTGFLLTICYKSVLLANMMSIEYEKGIDTIDDMINSKKTLMVIRTMEPRFAMNPPPRMKELSKQVQYFDFDKSLKVPQHIFDGYAFYSKLKHAT